MNYEYELLQNPSKEHLKLFIEKFRIFCHSKGITNTENTIDSFYVYELEHYRSTGALSFSYIKSANNPEIYIYRIDLIDFSTMRVRNCVMASSLYLLNDSNKKNNLSKLDCLLQWKNILYYRKIGLRTMDFGGVNLSRGDVSGVASFKSIFGGFLEKRYHVLGSYGKKKATKPHILLLCDRPNWAHHNSAIEIVNQLSDEFIFDIKYVIDNEKINHKQYDALLVFFWGEESYKKWHFPKAKIIKQVSSHRWQDNPMYGPLTVTEFRKKYLDDCKTVICPSQILYSLLKPEVSNLVLCGKGFSPIKFFYKHDRKGELCLCMVGNIKDPVKGVEDILRPSAEGYHLDLANDLKHEELCEFYNNHDVYVVSSKNEADPLPLIESMACGCFPVSSYVGIAPELIRHKENGYLVKNRTVEEFKEAFLWCKENIEFIRKQEKKNAEEIFERRRWEIMAENYRQMFRKHLGGN